MAKSGYDLLIEVCAFYSMDASYVALIVDEMVVRGGIELGELTPDLIMRGLRDAPDAPWKDLYWSCSEALPQYATSLREMLVSSPLPVKDSFDGFCALAAAILVAIGIPSGHGTGYELGKVCEVLDLFNQCYGMEGVQETLCFVADRLRDDNAPRWS